VRAVQPLLADALLGLLNEDDCPAHSCRFVAIVLVIRIFGLGFVSDFGFRGSDLAPARV
jgi:hypothetical protein